MAPKKRRDRGSGSIYPNKDGSWTAQERIDGRLVRRRAPDEPSARKRLEELQELKRARIDVHSGAQSVATWMGTYHTQKVRLRKLKPRSAEFNRDQIERYIIPKIGELRLRDVRPSHLQAVVDTLYAEIQDDGKYDGARTVQAVASILKEAFSLAYERKLILDNPYSGIVLPKYKRKKIDPLEDAQLNALFTAVANHRLCALFWTYALLGLRRGEGLGLRWAALDWDRGTIKIDQQVQRVNGGELMIGTPKTDDSVRELPLPRRLLTLYRERWDAAQAERELKDWKEHTLIFPSEVGTPMWPDNLEKKFRDFRAAAKLPKTVKLHHLRHTLSTLLDECGATEALKAGILGHAKATQTQKYTHARLKAMRAVLQAVEDRILGAAEDVEETGT